jgi:hypothetical protein
VALGVLSEGKNVFPLNNIRAIVTIAFSGVSFESCRQKQQQLSQSTSLGMNYTVDLEASIKDDKTSLTIKMEEKS